MAKYGVTFGSGGPGSLDGKRRQWREITQGVSGKTSCGANTTSAQRESSVSNGGNFDQFGAVIGIGKGGLADGLVALRAAQRAGEPPPEYKGQEATGTSIFDPVLCECVYRWFCPPGGLVLDPFAGGSVRGIVAAMLGRRYIGVDLRAEQVAANEAQAAAICPANRPEWFAGDSRKIIPQLAETGLAADLIFSCPPYADLERYSDDELDLSTMEYPAFKAAYRTIIAAAVGLLSPDRFACFVVGEVRCGKGYYRGFVADTVAAFVDAGMAYYNEAVLITPAGSLPVRVGKQFVSGRKLGKSHQNVLVFCKGDAKRAAATCPLSEEEVAA